MRQASSPGRHALQTSGLTAYTTQVVATPTSPTSAEHRSPSQRMRPWSSSTNRRGIRSRAASSSSENRGHSRENEQHAPQARHMESPSSGMSVAPVVITAIGLACGFADAGRWAAPGSSARGRFAWLRRRDETFTLRLLARQLARAANGFASLPCRSFRRLFVEASSLHLAEDAFPLHLLLENPKSLVDIVVANEYLQDLFLSCHGLRRGLPRVVRRVPRHARIRNDWRRRVRTERSDYQSGPCRGSGQARSKARCGRQWAWSRPLWRCGGSATGLSVIGACEHADDGLHIEGARLVG